MSSKSTNYIGRQRRHAKIRKKIAGTKNRPRLSVFRSARALYVQLIDDQAGLTLAAADSRPPKAGGQSGQQKSGAGKIDAAFAVGGLIAAKAKELGISTVVFDRGGYRYHGRVKAAAEGARAGGLKL